jgi:signal transduction histidine kinase
MLDLALNDGLSSSRDRSVIVGIVGSTKALADRCRANLQQLCPGGYHVHECGASNVKSDCDIYLWDFESSPSMRPAMVTRERATKVVIAKKSSLSSVQRKLSGADFTYLQAPVSPLALRAVLAAALARLQLRHDEGSKPARLKLDRDRLLQHLLQMNVTVSDHDQDRTNFLTRSIHDIRVPLMAVQGYCGLLLAGQVGSMDPEQTGILEKMQRSLTRLCGLVEAMMTLGTGSQATTKPKFERASIETCVQQAVYEIVPFVEKKQITLSVEVDAPTGTLLFDPGQLERVLVNLLDNASKFTPKGGAVTIRGRSVAAQELGRAGLPGVAAGYRIDVTDSGRGIDPDQIEQIFDEHTSFGDPMDRSGSGLGLAICRMIVQAHNGRIWANSGTQGASFSLVLPLVRSFNDASLSQVAV